MSKPVKIFSAGHVLPMHAPILSPGAIAVQADTLIGLGTPDELKAKYLGAEIVDYPSHVILPGLVNAHADLSLTVQSFCQNPETASSAASLSTENSSLKKPIPDSNLASFQGLDGRKSWARWLVELSRYKARLSISQQQVSIRQGLSLMQNCGVTTLGDKCRYPVAIKLYRQSGLRVVVLAEIENIQRQLAQEDFEQALALVDQIESEKNPRITAGLAPFSAYTLSKNLLRILSNHAQQLQVPLHLHAGLSFSEMEFFYDSKGEIAEVLFEEAGWQDKLPPPHHLTPLQYLLEIGFLQAKPAILGALHLGPTDYAILENRGCLAVFSPMAFRFLQLGQVPWEKIIDRKSAFALATLGSAWGASLNLWDEMRLALESISAAKQESAAIELLRAATLGGAGALKLESQIGSLAPGKQADWIAVAIKPDEKFSFQKLILNTQPENIISVQVAGQELRPAL